jgi:hypothetical protein
MTLKSIATWILAFIFSLFGPPANDLTFRPAIGSTFEKRFESDWNVTLVPLEIQVLSYDVMDMLPEGFRIEAILNEEVGIADTYLLVHRGFPLAFDRKFVDMSRTEELSTSPGNIVLQNEPWTPYSALERETVRFRAGSPDWEMSLVGRSTRYPYSRAWEALPGLVEEMDFRYLLPDAKAFEGDTWEVPPERVVDLLFPGGSFTWSAERWDGGQSLESILVPGLVRELRNSSKPLLEGTIEVTRWEQTDELVELGIEVDIVLGEDYATINRLASRLIETLVEDDSLTVDTNRLDLSISAKGTVFWNVERGHIKSLELEGEVESRLDLYADWGSTSGSDPALHLDFEMTGTFLNRVQAE